MEPTTRQTQTDRAVRSDRTDTRQALQRYFGYSDFRPGQREIIDSLLSGRDVMAVMPTGAGKSVCYQIPALVSEGVTLVISPLISLMKDQVNALCQAGIPAAYLNSSLSPAQFDRVCARMAAGAYRIVYVAPERLDVPAFARLLGTLPIPQLAVDEAHCVSQWGQDFRPGYLHIRQFIATLPNRPAVGAFTATATSEVRADIIRLLGLRDPYSVTTGFDRPNLWFGVRHARPKEKPAALMEFLQEHEGQSGIVYCSTRAGVEEVAAMLASAGLRATAYHAGMSDADRHSAQDDFLYDRKTVMVATNAFGMGIDKSNVSFVVHYNMPKSMEAYYQEAGRAGRDGTAADCLLLYTPGDLQTARFLIENGEPNPDLDEAAAALVRARDLERLGRMAAYATTAGCLRENILGYFGESLPPRAAPCDSPAPDPDSRVSACGCGNCSNCQGGLVVADITVESQMVLSCIARTGERLGQVLICQTLMGAKSRRVQELGLDKQTTYGLMKACSLPYVRRIIAYLTEINAIRVSDGDYPILTLGAAAPDILYRRIPVHMTVRADLERTSAAGKRAKSGTPTAQSRGDTAQSRGDTAQSRTKTARHSASGAVLTAEDSALYKALSDLRTELATAQKIPPYYIFTNATLEDMCRKKPTTPALLLEVNGVGEAKLRRYGERFLGCILCHLS